MGWFLDTAAVTAAVGLVSGCAVPTLIGRIPEPESVDETLDDADAATGPETVTGSVLGMVAATPEAPKELYVSIARVSGLRWKAAVASGVVAGLLGGRIGWHPELLPLLYLAPVGVALAVVDWRTRLLPTKVIAPSYAVVVALVAVAALVSRDWGDLERAGWGWAIAGGTFLLLWLVYPRGMGYGDVRLSGLLGIALGSVGWGPLLVGVYAGFLLGGLGGALLTVVRLVDRRAYPFGPFMLLGALVGVLWGGQVAELYLGA